MKHIGLIKGRHEMPVEEYIFESVENVFDFDAIRRHIEEYVVSNCDIKVVNGCPVNGFGDTDIYKGDNLCVYITGLTCVSIALVEVCAKCGVNLTLMHFDMQSGEYKPQTINWGV